MKKCHLVQDTIATASEYKNKERLNSMLKSKVKERRKWYLLQKSWTLERDKVVAERGDQESQWKSYKS